MLGGAAFLLPGIYLLLTPEDTQALAQALPKVILEGRSTRLMDVEFYTPQFRVQLKNGQTFDFSCYMEHYILDGQAYGTQNTKHIYHEIYELYQSTNNRSYFPPAEQVETNLDNKRSVC